MKNLLFALFALAFIYMLYDNNGSVTGRTNTKGEAIRHHALSPIQG